ncbi:hypothetical protein [Bradyrhizobium sp. LB13.1]
MPPTYKPRAHQNRAPRQSISGIAPFIASAVTQTQIFFIFFGDARSPALTFHCAETLTAVGATMLRGGFTVSHRRIGFANGWGLRRQGGFRGGRASVQDVGVQMVEGESARLLNCGPVRRQVLLPRTKGRLR